jgi:aerobic carbon-monoxide dehydrogenase medium subunit
MYPASFSYQRVTSVADAIAALKAQPDAELLAGGHSLIPAMKLRLSAPTTLVDLAGIKELSGIRRDGPAMVIGALTRHRDIERSKELMDACPILPEAARFIGDPQVRNRGTIGGSLAHADPAADLPACVLALGGSLEVEGPNGRRSIAADDFFQGLFTTALQPQEVLTAVRVPASTLGTGMAYEKFPHPASRYAIVGVAVVVHVADGKCREARVALTGAAPKAMRLTALEGALAGQTLDDKTLTRLCKDVVPAGELMGDGFASAEYRAHLTAVLARRALSRAAARLA